MLPGPMTYEEFTRLPEGTPAQLIAGTLVCEPSPSVRHQDALNLLLTALTVYAHRNGIGRVLPAPIDVRLADDEVYQPDIILIANEHFSRDATMIVSAPMLVVEVLSPSTAYYDLRHKRDVYARSGVDDYGIVDPLERLIEVLINRGGVFQMVSIARSGDVAYSHVAAGFSIAVDEVMPARDDA